MTRWLAARYRGGFPLATFFINGSGCFVLGLLTVVTASIHDVERVAALQSTLTTGFLGGYTTFSTYALDSVLLARGKAFTFATLNWLGSVAVGLAAAGAGGGLAHVLRP